MKKFLILFLFLSACSNDLPSEISPADLKQDALILDVRTPAEHQAASLAQDHWLVPLDQLNAAQFVQEHKLDGSKPLYIFISLKPELSCHASGKGLIEFPP